MTYIPDAFAIFHDADGTPLESGFIYIGEPGLDPETNPKQVYYDDGFSITAAQPIRTASGRPAAADGTTASNIYIGGEYSIRVKDRNGVTVSYIANADGIITYMPTSGGTFTGAITGTAATFSQRVIGSTLRITSTGDVSTVSTNHGLQIGPDSGLNLRADVNEMQVLDNGTPSTMGLQSEGGDVNLGAASSTINLPGTLDINGSLTVDGDFSLSRSWQDVSGSRVTGTYYQNTTGKPILVNIICEATSPGAGAVRVSATNSGGVIVGAPGDSSSPNTVSFEVDPGDWYSLSSGGVTTFSAWAELR